MVEMSVFCGELGSFINPNNVSSVRETTDTVQKRAENVTADKDVSTGKIPSYAAVEVNGLVVFMPVEQIPEGAKVLSGTLSSVDDMLKAMSIHHNVVTTSPLEDVKAVQTSTGRKDAEALFEVKPELQEKFDSLMKELEADKSPFGWNSGLKDMKKIMSGLEKLCKDDNMTVQGYADLAKTIDPDLPGFYWTKAIRIYNEYGVNAKPKETLSVVRGYLSGVPTINGFSNDLR